jgi:hypothetical protein
MIQRIQSVWLLVAAIVMASLFYFPTYEYTGGSKPPLTIGEDFLAIIMTAVSIGLSLFTIFNFKKRKQQIGLTWLNILLCLGLQVWLVVRVNNITTSGPDISIPGHYWIGLFIPFVTIILLFLAKAGMNKDEKLVKSLDRLR